MGCSGTRCMVIGSYSDAAGQGHGLIVTGSGTTWTRSKRPCHLTHPPQARRQHGAWWRHLDASSTSSAVIWTARLVPRPPCSWTKPEESGTRSPLHCRGDASSSGAGQVDGVACPSGRCRRGWVLYLNSGKPGRPPARRWTLWSAVERHPPLTVPAQRLGRCWLGVPERNVVRSRPAPTRARRRRAPFIEWGWGTAWQAVSAPLPPGTTTARLNGVACTSATDCEAAGSCTPTHKGEMKAWSSGLGRRSGPPTRWHSHPRSDRGRHCAIHRVPGCWPLCGLRWRGPPAPPARSFRMNSGPLGRRPSSPFRPTPESPRSRFPAGHAACLLPRPRLSASPSAPSGLIIGDGWRLGRPLKPRSRGSLLGVAADGGGCIRAGGQLRRCGFGGRARSHQICFGECLQPFEAPGPPQRRIRWDLPGVSRCGLLPGVRVMCGRG